MISICIPAYHAERYLGETMASVRAQTHGDWELIVVEDGSDDGTRALVECFAADVSQSVRYLRHEENRGLSATRNAGFAAARGEWIALLDADDLWLPSHLADLVAAAESARTHFAFASSQIFDSSTGVDGPLRAALPDQIRDPASALYRGELVIQPSGVLFARELLARHGGFDSRYAICNDLEFWLRLAVGGERFAHTGCVTCRYRKHDAAMSRRSGELIAEVARIRRDYGRRVGLPAGQVRQLTAQAFWDAARIARRHNLARSIRWGISGLFVRLVG